MPKTNRPHAWVWPARMRPLAFALLAVGGGCGDAEDLARQQAEEIKAISARLDELEAEQARMAAQRLPSENEAEVKELVRKHAEVLEAVNAKLAKLEVELTHMEAERTALDGEIEAAKGDETRRKALEAKLVELEKKMTESEAADR